LARPPQHHHRAPHDRQWLMLPQPRLPHLPQPNRHPAHPYPPLYAKNQRQGRSRHPDKPAPVAHAYQSSTERGKAMRPWITSTTTSNHPRPSAGSYPPARPNNLPGSNRQLMIADAPSANSAAYNDKTVRRVLASILHSHIPSLHFSRAVSL